ncbi:putative aarF domain-containing protein kinase 1, partial [Nowakowskiella sp. JEL0078]
MKRHGINPVDVSTELTKAFSEMIFVHGFVHCDPHPANVFIKHIPTLTAFTPNFQIILLDHGLYRTLAPSFQLSYARLWDSLINGDEAGIESSCYALFTLDDHTPKHGIHHHRLFASMLTGRSWDVISSPTPSSLSTPRTQEELETVSTNAENGYFFQAIIEILAKIPRELLLLLKTNDLLRSVDNALGVGAAGSDLDHMLRIVSVMGWYCAACVRRDAIARVQRGEAL